MSLLRCGSGSSTRGLRLSGIRLGLGLKKIIGLMPTYIYRSVFERPGIEMEYLGPVEAIGRHKCRAVAIPVTGAATGQCARQDGDHAQRSERSLLQERERAHAKVA